MNLSVFLSYPSHWQIRWWKAVLEQTGCLCAGRLLLLCLSILGVDVRKGNGSIDKRGARSCKKFVLHVHREGTYPVFPLLCPLQLNLQPRLCWNMTLFLFLFFFFPPRDYVWLGIFLNWGRLIHLPSLLVVICSGRFGVNFCFLARMREQELLWLEWNVLFQGIECGKKPVGFIQTMGFVCTQSVWIHWSPKCCASMRDKSSFCYFKTA